MELETIATTIKRIPRLALLGLGFIVSLAVTFSMVPPESAQSDVVTPRESTPLPRFFNHPELVVIDVRYSKTSESFYVK